MQTIRTNTIVVGGGISGIAAAHAVAESNKKVILIDSSPQIGGNSVNANVGTICGAYYRSFHSMRVSGNSFTKFFLDVLSKSAGISKPIYHQNGLYIIPYQWPALKSIYDDMLHANHVAILNGSVEKLTLQSKRICTLTVSTAEGHFEIVTDAIVDCSGQAAISQLAGIETLKEKSYQAASQVFRLANIGNVSEYTLNFSIKRSMVKNSAERNWPMAYTSLSVVPGSIIGNMADLKLTLPDLITDNLSIEILKDKASYAIGEIMHLLKMEIKSLEASRIETIFPQPGIRILQRSRGKYMLTEQDVLSCHKPSDGIAVGSWPMEVWANDGRLSMEYFGPDDGYYIPAGCLISDQLENLFFGGKNISATPKAIASARVIGTAWQTGYAAGKLSCSENKIEQIKTIEALHDELS